MTFIKDETRDYERDIRFEMHILRGLVKPECMNAKGKVPMQKLRPLA